MVIVTVIYNKKMDHIIMNKIFKVSNDDLDEISKQKIELVVDHKFTENEQPLNENVKKKDHLFSSNDQPLNENMKRNYLDNSSKNETLAKPNNLIIDINKLIESRKSPQENNFYITLEEFVCFSFCRCFASEKVKKKDIIFTEMTKYTLEYTDIVNYALLKSEFEKLLFVIFTKRQLALFNMILSPQNPERKGDITNVTKAFQFTKDIAEQEIVVLKTKEWDGDLDKKLLHLLY
jgi:hypothetical protein